MNRPLVNGPIPTFPPTKIQHTTPNNKTNRLCQTYNRAPVELRLRSQFQPSLPERPAHTLLVAARHQQALLSLVGRGVDEIQEAPLMSSVLTISRHTLHRPRRTIVPPGQHEYPVCDRRDR